MTRKEQTKYDYYWRLLQECNFEKGGRVTAGEFARHCGIARNTAKKVLERMCELDAIDGVRYTAKNGFGAVEYGVFNLQDKLQERSLYWIEREDN